MYSNLVELGILIFANTLSLLLTILVLANSSKGNKNFWLAAMSITIIGWVNTAFLGFALPNADQAILFYKLNGAFVPLFLISAYYFYFENFLGIKSNLIKGVHVTVNLSISFLSLFTDFMVTTVEQKEWGNELVFGPLFTLFILYSSLFSGVLATLLLRKYILLGRGHRKEVTLFLTGTVIFIVSNIVFNVLSPVLTETSRFQHFGDYSSVIFLAFTVYAIFRTNFLNIKTAATSVLIALLGMLILVDIFVLSRNLAEQGIKFFVLMLFALLSVFLVRSVLREIRQKEELEKVNKALDRSRQRYLDLATEQKDIIDVMGHEIRTPLTAIVQEIKLHKKHTMPLEKELLAEGKGENLKKLLPF